MYAILFLFFFKWILVVHQLSMVCFNVLRGIALIGACLLAKPLIFSTKSLALL